MSADKRRAISIFDIARARPPAFFSLFFARLTWRQNM
jgi:hypothetical protein